MDTIAIERNIWIDAPRERVWQAITDPEQIAKWFLPSTMPAQIKRGDDDILSLGFGPMEVAFAALESIDSPRQVTSRSLPDRQLATTYMLAEEEGGTKVTVRMTGFEALPENARQDRFKLSTTAWEQTLQNLKAFLDGKESPFPMAGVAPLFGYWREVRQKAMVERSIWIDAPRERVWRALTEPEQVQKWFSPGSTFKTSGTGVGSRLYVEDPETGAEMYVQFLDVFEPPQHLVMRSQAEPPENLSFVTSYMLDLENSGTRLTLTYTGYEGWTDEIRQNLEQNTFGFGMMLANLKATIEGTPLPVPGGF
jgi:uncharacterized protein YndB with AHSA1/START domain